MLIPGRHEASGSYRYGFQGQEKDDEIKGEGNSLNYTFRMHDPRVGRFFALDPLSPNYPWYTPYSFSGNKVIAYVEFEGLEDVWVVNEKFEVIHKVGPYLDSFSSKESAQKASAFKMRTPTQVKEFEKVAKQFNHVPSKPNDPVVKKGLSTVEKAALDPVMYPGSPLGIGGGVAIGVSEVVSDMAVTGIIDKTAKVYSIFKRSNLAVESIKSAENLASCEEFIDNADDVLDLYKAAKIKAVENTTNSGKAVLGSYPEYIIKAKETGNSYFDIGKLWDNLVANGQNTWEVNKVFLDKIAEKGDEVIITLGKNADGTTKTQGKYLQKEIEYLTEEKGYIWKDANKTILTKPN